MINPKTEEDRRQLAYLATPVGVPGSGRQRYAAAMYFFAREMIDAATLEAYRVCSPIDREDPAGLVAALKSTSLQRSSP